MVSSFQTGIDLLILRGPDLDQVVQAVSMTTGLALEAVSTPRDQGDKSLSILEFPYWAVVHCYEAGDFGFKVDLDSKSPPDYIALGRALAKFLDVGVAWPDERTLAPNAAVLCLPSGDERACTIDDLSDDRDGLVLTIVGG